MLILVSLLCTLIFGFLAILTLNYVVFRWENKKVSELTSQIKPTENSLLQKTNSTRGFTSVDLGNAFGKSRALVAAGHFYDKALSSFHNLEKGGRYQKLSRNVHRYLKRAWRYLKHLYSYLISLTKPVTSVSPRVALHEELQKRKQKDDIDQLIEKVGTTETKFDQDFEQFESDIHEYPTSDTIDSEADINLKEATFNITTSPTQVATINFASQEEGKSEHDMSIFEKLEARILEKLKHSGLNHYDVWLELGNLYEKYNEKEKAVEVFALVLKHSDGKEKELARNKLIGLS